MAAQKGFYSFNHASFGKQSNRAGAAGDNAAYNADFSKTDLDELHKATLEHWLTTGKVMEDVAFDKLVEQIYQRSAAANIAYNARTEATWAVRSHIIPPDPARAKAWFDAQEAGERKNARMSDRFIAALPREFTPEQSLAAVEEFCRTVTQDRVPWHFALHLELDKQHDADWNPHAHIIFRDRDILTGKRFLYTSAGPKERHQLDQKGIKWWDTREFRRQWEKTVNTALERAGSNVRVDHRTLREQGIDRVAGIHEGPRSRAKHNRREIFTSKDHRRGNNTVTAYTQIDRGSRVDYNAEIKVANDRLIKTRAPSPEQIKARKFQRTRAARGVGKQLNTPQPPAAPAAPHNAIVLPKVSPAEAQRMALQRAQLSERRQMWQEQKADRQALREVHNAEIAQHKARFRIATRSTRDEANAKVAADYAPRWTKLLGMPRGEARQAAIEQTLSYGKRGWQDVKAIPPGQDHDAAAKQLKARLAKQWQLIRGAPKSADKDASVAALKTRARADRERRATTAVGEVIVKRDSAWKAVYQRHVAERMALGKQHSDENTALVAKHAAQNMALQLRQHAARLQTDVNRVNFQLGKQHTDAGQGRATAKLMKLRRRMRFTKGAGNDNRAIPVNPLAAAAELDQVARDRADKNSNARAQLTAARAFNRLRALRGGVANIIADHPRSRSLPRARQETAVAYLARLIGNDERSSAEQAAKSGKPLTPAQIANLPPELHQTTRRRDSDNDKASRDAEFRRDRLKPRDRGGGRER